MRRRHQTDCGNELHSFCQSGIIEPPSVCSLQTGMADQLWHKQNSTLGANPGTDYASAEREWGEGEFSGWFGLPFLWLKLQGPSPEPACLPTDCPGLGGLFFHCGNVWLGSSTRHCPYRPQRPRAPSLLVLMGTDGGPRRLHPVPGAEPGSVGKQREVKWAQGPDLRRRPVRGTLAPGALCDVREPPTCLSSSFSAKGARASHTVGIIWGLQS